MNQCVYIHELIEIIGHNRANYMHHITANWSPIGQAERDQRCFGVFGTVGSTRVAPEVVNIWEHSGWDGLADAFEHEFSHPTLQDPSLAEWWARAASFRGRMRDRILVPAPWTRTIEELCADGVTGVAYAQEIVRVRAGSASSYLDAVRDLAVGAYRAHGLELVAAWRTAMCGESECVVMWAIPGWRTWGRFEAAQLAAPELVDWTRAVEPFVVGLERFLLVDAPLSPLRTGRQPRVEDRASFELPAP
ncbi:MAG: hypothetical protein AMXMBFR46_22530 [Acidimicrobiia bacterium]